MRRVLLAFVCLIVFTQANAQKKKTATGTPPAADAQEIPMFKNLNYRLIGPFRGGRAAAVAGSYKNKNTFYFGATGGGVWKTTDGGSNWANISGKYFGGSIGAVAVAPSD